MTWHIEPLQLRHWTILAMVAAIFVIAGYDAYCESVSDDATITAITREASHDTWVIPMALGVLAGHLCGQFPFAFVYGYLGGTLFWNPVGDVIRDWIFRKGWKD